MSPARAMVMYTGKARSIAARGMAGALLALVVVACSWTHHVRIENATDSYLQVAYKLSCPHGRCFFPDTAVVKPRRGDDPSTWRTHRIDPQDSIIRFTLPPGHSADMATTWNTTYSYIHGGTSAGAPRDNLVWLEVITADRTTRYTPTEFLEAADIRRSGRTLLRFTDQGMDR